MNPLGIMIALAIEGGIAADVIAWLNGFGLVERLVWWAVLIIT